MGGSDEEQIMVWSVETGELVKALRLGPHKRSAIMSLNGNTAAYYETEDRTSLTFLSPPQGELRLKLNVAKGQALSFPHPQIQIL